MPGCLLRRIALIIAWVATAIVLPPSLQAQDTDDDENLVNYAYASVFGTGFYRAGDQTVTVLRLPFSYSLREADDEYWGVRLLLPVTAGFHDFDTGSALEGQTADDVATLSFVPGLGLEIPLSRRWLLKPYANLGLGAELDSDEYSYIYVGGVSSRYRLPSERYALTLGNGLFYAGYTPDNGESDGFASLATGLDVVYPLRFELGSAQAGIGTYFIYHLYLDDPKFAVSQDQSTTLDDEYEIGLAVVPDSSFRLLGIRLQRLGLAYRFGNELDAVRLVTDFPF